MPDFADYNIYIYAGYAVAAVILSSLAVASVLQSRKVKHEDNISKGARDADR